MAKRIVPSNDKLSALREAARLGFEALDRGQFKEFSNPGEIKRYLYKLSQRAISKSKSPRPRGS